MLGDIAEQLGQDIAADGNKDEVIAKILQAEKDLAAAGEATEPPGDAVEVSKTPETDAQVKTFFVRATPKAGFFRCGFFIPHEGAELNLTQAQYERMLDEPKLVIDSE